MDRVRVDLYSLTYIPRHDRTRDIRDINFLYELRTQNEISWLELRGLTRLIK